MTNTVKRTNCKLLIFTLVLLFNPSVNVVDVFPDFIAWFILARLFERAADSAPYFEEARSSFIRLGWLSLFKIPAFLLILYVRSKDTLDNNVYALVSFTFAVFEIILATQATKNLFSALFYLGERTDAPSLIEPFTVSEKKNRLMTPEALKNLTYLFFILKAALYAVPDLFLLTGVNDRGIVVIGSKYYPYVLLASLLVGIVFGAAWLAYSKKYVSKVCAEGKFYEALDSIATDGGEGSAEKKSKLRALLRTPTVMIVAAFFSMELIFENLSNINILPHFIYGIMLLLVWHSFKKHSKLHLFTGVFGVIYCVVSLIGYITTVSFFSKYEYMDLIKNSAARSDYNAIMVLSVIEFICLIFFLVFITKAFNSYILKNTGISPDSENYNKLEAEFHRSLKIKNYVTFSLGILSGLSKCVNVFLNSDVQVLFTETNTITASTLPWFGTIVTVTSVAYIAYNLFFMSTLKDEVRMKYQSI